MLLPAKGSELTTAEQMIEALGGPQTVAELFELTDYRTPSMWRKRGVIPPIYRPEVARLLTNLGFKYPESFLLPPTKANQ